MIERDEREESFVIRRARVCNQSHSAFIFVRSKRTKIYNVLEILIVLYILNAVYPDNGVTTHGLYEESVIEEESFAP